MAKRNPTPNVGQASGFRMIRVQLTAEMVERQRGSSVWFRGEYQGEPVAVEVYDVGHIIALRKALDDYGAVYFQSMAYRVDLLPRPALPADLSDLRDAVKVGRVGGASDGAQISRR